MAHFVENSEIIVTDRPARPTYSRPRRSYAATEGQRPLFTKASVAPEKAAPAVRPNRYGAKCVDCSAYVPEGEGRLDKVEGKWVVRHIAPCPAPEVSRVEASVTIEPGSETLYDGIYTVEAPGAHRTFRLRTQREDADFMPGAQLIAFLSGADNDSDYTNFGSIKDGKLKAWRRFTGNIALVRDAETLLADPAGALSSASCFRCGRTLTVPASVHNGLGPECAKKARL